MRGERQIGQAAVGERFRMVASPGRLPDGGAGDLESHGDLGELVADRLVLDDAAAALHAQLRVVERRLVGGAADAEIESGGLRWIAARLAGERAFMFAADKIFRRHPAVLEYQLAAGAVIPAPLRSLSRTLRPGVSRGTRSKLAPFASVLDFDGEQLGDRRVGDAVLDAVDDPGVARAHRRGLHAGFAGVRAMIVDAERGIAIGLVVCQRKVIASSSGTAAGTAPRCSGVIAGRTKRGRAPRSARAQPRRRDRRARVPR